MKNSVLVMLLLLTTLMPTAVFGQSPTDVGNLAGVQYGDTHIDEVSMTDLNVHLDIPIVTKSGIGLPFHASITHDNNMWHVITDGLHQPYWWDDISGFFGNHVTGDVISGWHYKGEIIGQGVFLTTPNGPCSNPPCTYIYGYLDPDNVYHAITNGNYSTGVAYICAASGCTNSFSEIFPDGSGIYMFYGVDSHNFPTAYAMLPDGTTLYPQINNILGYGGLTGITKDTNGNTLTSQKYFSPSFTDTFNTTPLSLSFSPTQAIWSYPGPSGAQENVTVTLTSLQRQSKFGCPGVNDIAAQGVTLPTSIQLPDGSTYQFSYESEVAGTVTDRLASITYPDGYVVQYFYPGASAHYGINCSDGTTMSLTRTTVDGTSTFSRSTDGLTATVTGPAPASNVTKFTFSQDSKSRLYYPTTKTIYQGSSAPLLTRTFCYNSNQTNCASAAAPSLPVNQVDVYSKFGTMSTSLRNQTTFDSYGNHLTESTYDFGATTPTYKTVNSNIGKTWNGSISSPTCATIGSGVNNAPCQTETFDKNGAPIHNTFFSYDSRGNLLEKSTWVSGSITTGQYLNSIFLHDSNGLISQTSDANGNANQVTYGVCNGGLPTTSSPDGTSIVPTTISWDSSCSGVPTSMLGPNGFSESLGYTDPFWRPTSATDEAQNTTNFSYSPTTVESTSAFGTTNLDKFVQLNTTLPTLDNYVQTLNPNNQWDTLASSQHWDGTGVVIVASMPCSTTKKTGCKTLTATTTHDALGRALVATDGGGGTKTNTYVATGALYDVVTVVGPPPVSEVVKKVQKEYNGVGQLLSICQLSSASGSVPCGQANGGTGFLTTYIYDTTGNLKSSTNGTQTHSFTYDVAGRVLTSTYPESGKTYSFYDAAPTSPGVDCSTVALSPNYSSLGNLLKTYDANGNTACYSYDILNRVTSIAYSGPNFDGSNKYYVYDHAALNGTPMVNTKGRLAEAYTASGPTQTVSTGAKLAAGTGTNGSGIGTAWINPAQLGSNGTYVNLPSPSKIPGTGVNGTGVAGNVTWLQPSQTNIGNTYTETLANTTPSRTTVPLQVSTFGFSLPSSFVPSGIVVSFQQASTCTSATGCGGYFKVQLMKNGVAVGTPKTAPAHMSPVLGGPTWEYLTPLTLGGVGDLWGTTLTYSDLNSSTFGVSIVYYDLTSSSDGYDTVYAEYLSVTPLPTGGTLPLQATNFGFSLPSNFVPNGITVSFKQAYSATSSLPNGQFTVQLLKNGTPVGVARTVSASYVTGNPSSQEVALTLGSSNDLWGTTFVYSDLNSSTFGAQITYNDLNPKGTDLVYADYLTIAASGVARNTVTPVTDELFSYTSRGEPSDLYLSTPNSNGYYHTFATYYPNGQLSTLGGLSNNTFEFFLDSKGRPSSSSVLQGATQQLVSSVVYDAADHPTIVNYGQNGDADTYSYDPGTGKMTNYTFSAGAPAKSLSGTLTWNQNGTLRQLAIADSFHSGGSQTCQYGTSTVPGYDELGRLLHVDCGASTWQQDFTYDAFNNLKKTVPPGGAGTPWNPGYDPATNHYLLTGTTYDASGDLLTDTFHTYSWNEDGLLAGVSDANVTLVYDALGRLVENNTSGVYRQMVYTPIGKTAVYNGQNVVSYTIPQPGKSGYGAYGSCCGPAYFHSDWLNSVRLITDRVNRTDYVDRAFAPYGEVYKEFGGPLGVNFTGDAQDVVPGTYDTSARELNPSQGRWISPDPTHASWNAYAYSADPLGKTDPSGLDDFCGDLCSLWFGDGSLEGLPSDVITNYYGNTWCSCSSFQDYYAKYDEKNHTLYPQYPAFLVTTIPELPSLANLPTTPQQMQEAGWITPAQLGQYNDAVAHSTAAQLEIWGETPNRHLGGFTPREVQGLGGAWLGGFMGAMGSGRGFLETPSLTPEGPYPGNMGFLGEPETTVLQEGTLIDRYGSETGKFVSPAGTPREMRSLAPWSSSELSTYKVVRPITVKAGPVQPWFGHPGMGMQYQLQQSVRDLVNSEALKVVH
jgi:RHS repeat-associated protein